MSIGVAIIGSGTYSYNILYAVHALANIEQVSLRKSNTLYGKLPNSTIFYIIYLTN